MLKLISEPLRPYYETYSDLISQYEDVYSVAEVDEELTQAHIDTLDGADFTQDQTAQFFASMTQDAYDEAARISESIDLMLKELKNPEMIQHIRESRLAILKKIAELEESQPEIEKLTAEIDKKVEAYAEKENVSQDIASIMLKAGDKGFRAKCLKLSQLENPINDAKQTMQTLSRMERDVTGLAIPEDLLEKFINGKGVL